MAALNLTDPNHPTWSYPSSGGTVTGGVQCSCGTGDVECLRQCRVTAQAALDAVLAVVPET